MIRQERADALRAKLAVVGVLAIYSGRKGHGFWLSEGATPAADAAIRSGAGFDMLLKDARREIAPDQFRSLKNDGQASGNEWFWMFADAERLCAERAVAQAEALMES